MSIQTWLDIDPLMFAPEIHDIMDKTVAYLSDMGRLNVADREQSTAVLKELLGQVKKGPYPKRKRKNLQHQKIISKLIKLKCGFNQF